MKKLLLTFLIILIPWIGEARGLMGVMGGGGACGDTIKDTDTIGTSAGSNIAKDDTDDYLHAAFKFQAGYTYNATKVTIKIGKTVAGNPAGTITLNLCSDNAGSPYANGNANCVASSNTMTQTDVSTSGTDVTFVLSSVKAISNGSSYHIKLTASELGTSTVYWIIYKDSDASSGLGFKRSADDATWAATDSDSGADYDVITCE